MPTKPLPFLEDIELPGHRGFPDMSMSDRLWLVDPRNRQAVANLWACIVRAPLCIMGTYGYLTSDELEDAGICWHLVSHWRTITYTDAGERVETIPGSMIAHDLALLGLGREAVEQGTVVSPRPRPAPVKPATARSPRPTEPVVIRRREVGVARAR